MSHRVIDIFIIAIIFRLCSLPLCLKVEFSLLNFHCDFIKINYAYKDFSFFVTANLNLLKYIGKDSVHKDLGFLKYMCQGNIITGTLGSKQHSLSSI